VLSQETEVQKEIYAEAWYRYVLILWYMASFSIGGSGLIVLALSGGIELNSSFPSTVGSVKIAILPGGIQAYVQIYGIIVAINIGLLWLFILLLLPRWFVSSNQTALAVLTFVWIVFMSVNVYFAGFIGFLYIGAWESGLAKEDYGG
jgi:hypothetical protein